MTQQTGRDQTFSCPANSEVVGCDFEGAEPIDMPLTSVCSSGDLSLEPAQEATVVVVDPVVMTVEWLNTAAVVATPVLATRHIAPQPTLKIPVSRSSDRFLRFSRPGVSPVTVRGRDVVGDRGWVLPDAVNGGEMFARIQPALVMPKTYTLTGPRMSDVSPSDCSILLTSFDYRNLGAQADGNAAFLVRNFPRVNNLLFTATQVDTAWQKVTMSPDGVVQLFASTK